MAHSPSPSVAGSVELGSDTIVVKPRPRGKSFLDLPNEVRHRIYELVIYDHDRSVVCYPRGVPRKVTPETDADVKYAIIMENEGEDTPHYFAWPVNKNGSYAAGVWVNQDSNPVPSAQHECQDSESESDAGCETLSPGLNHDEVVAEDVLSHADAMCCGGPEDEDEPCYCDCHYAVPDHDGESEDDFSALTCGGAELDGECYCVCHGEYLEEMPISENEDVSGRDWSYDACYYFDVLEESDEEDEDSEEDDDEHYDSKERIGMLYEPVEPPILLTCQAIRSECLSIYYGRNAFSWRFLWLDYTRSLDRFDNWVDTIRHDDVKLMTSLTFEGRHSVEEGIEFTADIDLLEDNPGFDVKVNCEGLDDATGPIQRALEKDLVWTLWKASRGSRTLTFSTKLLRSLGGTFVKGMQRDPAEVECAEEVVHMEAVDRR